MADAENKVLFGLDKVHIAFSDGQGGYEKPVAVKGAVELTLDPEGDQNIFYADNIAYYTVNSNAGYSGELSMAKIPNEILAKMLGWIVDKNGALVEVADGVPTTFALMYDVQGDIKPRHGVTYNITANRPSEDWSTKEDTTEVNPFVLPYTASAIEVEGIGNVVRANIELTESNKEAYDSFFTKVYMPEKAE